MRCERSVELLTQSPGRSSAEGRRLAAEHAATCEDCRNAIEAVHRLRGESLARMPAPRAGAFERALAAATSRPAADAGRPRTFWAGIGIGAALAAGIAIAVVSFAPLPGTRNASATPEITMALNEQRDVSISLATPEALVDAEIHVVLSGAIGLSGFEGQRELRWRTNLDSGINQLTLPVVALGTSGGQLLVEVLHGAKRRTFVVDIRGLG
jgi:hypothetical protein